MRCLLPLALFAPALSWAYRPFDGTDADVAPLKAWEAEVQPVGYYWTPEEKWLVAPAVVMNYGIARDTEVVVQGEAQEPLNSAAGSATRVVESGLFVKRVLRDGVLQEQAGPSVATEIGLLTPDVNGDHGVGATIAGIVSQRWSFGTLHLNAQVGSNRQHRLDLFGSLIAEGPHDWKVRPVSEVYVERTAPTVITWSRLAGAIWQRSEDLALDVGYRFATTGPLHEHEIRLGFTWAFGRRD